MRILLGSQSPRRKEILGYFSLPFEQVASLFDEDTVSFTGDPHEYVCTLSRCKAETFAIDDPSAIIITADTTVYREGKIYGKPRSPEEGFKALSELQGRWHSVFTGVAVRQGERVFVEAEETKVEFNPLTPEQIHTYQDKLHCADKAGGYAIQQAGSLIVRRIEGCYYNVMGLPIHTLDELLQKVGIKLWDFLA